MSARLTDDEIKQIVEHRVRKELAPVPVRLSVRRDVDWLDRPILRVMVSYERGREPGDREMLSLPRLIWDDLGDAWEQVGLPVVSSVIRGEEHLFGVEFA